MKNNKGQALVEFIIVMPVLILLLLAIIDFTRILEVKSELEGILEVDIEDDAYVLDDGISLDKVTTDGEISYYLRKKIDLYSPFLTAFMDNPYEIEIKRVVYEK